MKNSRDFYSTVQKKFGAMPFNLRSFDSETKAKMGVVECVTHKLVEPFQVLHEKDSKFVFRLIELCSIQSAKRKDCRLSWYIDSYE